MAAASRSAAITLIRAARRCRGWLEQLAAAALAALAVATTAPRATRGFSDATRLRPPKRGLRGSRFLHPRTSVLAFRIDIILIGM